MALLERGAQLAALAQYAQDARDGAGRLVLVAGEAGIGKSALVDGLRGELAGTTFLSGACDGMFTPRPLAPLHDVAEQVGGELRALTTSDTPRDALFAAVLHWLARVEDLVVLVVEDVHWADEATLDLLRLLGRRVRDLPVLLVVTYRDDGLGAAEPLRLVLGELVSHRSTRRVTVPPLSPDAVAVLAEGSGMAPDELYRLTGGNPFFVSEVVRAGGHTVPPSARDAVLARVAPLTVAARRVLETAAVVGTRIEPAFLAAVSAPSVRGDDALDELVATGLLVSEGPVLRFAHELTRVAVAQATPAHRAGGMHARVLARLLAGRSTDAARLAHHAEGAGDEPAVLTWAPRAAHEAAALGSHREAALQYERALRFADPGDPVVVADLCDALSREQSLVDRWEDAAAVARRALDLWRALDDRVRVSHTERFLSRVMWRLNRGSESLAHAEEALAAVRGHGRTSSLAWALADLALARYHASETVEARRLCAEALDLAEHLDLPDVVSDVLNTLSCLLLDAGEDWLPAMLRALEVAVTAGLDPQAGRAYANLHTCLALTHRFAECDHYFREGTAYCEEHDIATFGTCLRSSQAEVDLAVGRWDAALEVSRQMLANPAISPANQLTPMLTIGRVEGRRGVPTALGVLDDAVASALGTGEDGWVADALPARAETRWLTGDVDGAREDLLLAARAAGDPWHLGVVATWLARLGVRLDVDPDTLPTPDGLTLRGDHEGAAAAWDRLCSPFDAALSWYDTGTEAGLREALRRFEALGADAAAAVTRREMRRLGVRSIPAGARPATRAHPAGLTPRERDVLVLLCESLTNDEIADRLVISPKTVDHHVSAVLAKLGVPSRQAAAAEAARLGLVAAPA